MKLKLVLLISTLLLVSCILDPASDELVEITTRPITDITNISAMSGIDIHSYSIQINNMGICWSSSRKPTTSDNKIVKYGGNSAESCPFIISRLSPNTTYFVRAFVTYGAETVYGNQVKFTTSKMETGTLIDVDGNEYSTVKIGDQWWMSENLKVKHFRNGIEIPNVSDTIEWIGQRTSARCYPANIESDNILYNYYCIVDSNGLAPEGWHIPSDEEWKQLETYLGIEEDQLDVNGWRGNDEADILRSENGWDTGIEYANDYEFSAIPTGARDQVGYFGGFQSTAVWWSTTVVPTAYSYDYSVVRILSDNHSDILRTFRGHIQGLGIRCVKDTLVSN